MYTKNTNKTVKLQKIFPAKDAEDSIDAGNPNKTAWADLNEESEPSALEILSRKQSSADEYKENIDVKD